MFLCNNAGIDVEMANWYVDYLGTYLLTQLHVASHITALASDDIMFYNSAENTHTHKHTSEVTVTWRRAVPVGLAHTSERQIEVREVGRHNTFFDVPYKPNVFSRELFGVEHKVCSP